MCDNMDDLEGIMLSEINKTEKENTEWFHLYVESKRHQTNKLKQQNRNGIIHLESKQVFVREEGLGWVGM